VRILWDEPKRQSNLALHRLDFADVGEPFLDEALVVPSYAGLRGEPRYRAIGLLEADLVTLIFSPLGTEAISLISLRRASRKERRIYGAR
jgi:uncharacterized DUF497 family protein